MDTQHPSAPSCAPPANPRGVTHINVRQTTRYTVVGNHLAQHRQLSLLAIGLAVHIQSLPSSARVDIKTLAARFPEGETRIAAALRELETHGYLARSRERLPSGRVVTRTVSYNQPRAEPQAGGAPIDVRRDVRPDAQRDEQEAAPEPAAPAPSPKPPLPPPPIPEPEVHDLESHRIATDLLAALHRDDPRLLLAERDVRRLAPGVAAWLERGAAPEAVRRTLTANLPQEPLRHPAALLAHRLIELLPPPVPVVRETPRPHPFQTCEDCDRAFRAPEPGRCRDCRSDQKEAA
ncbi:helix-turn-helix domain-containing protein [Streptomyces sp. 2A115]|uniref:helix-turn-helix domain-containing protein n=1 Tax=Streptomyces sp. 2A115 TaxID=3457439 RepID=UPI003FD2EF69